MTEQAELDHESEGTRRRGPDSPAMLPDLEPPAPSWTEKLVRIWRGLGRRTVQDEPIDFRDRPERGDLVACLTVYAITASVGLVCLPVGLALVVFNLLGGENFRTTAHVTALTGLGASVSLTGIF